MKVGEAALSTAQRNSPRLPGRHSNTVSVRTKTNYLSVVPQLFLLVRLRSSRTFM